MENREHAERFAAQKRRIADHAKRIDRALAEIERRLNTDQEKQKDKLRQMREAITEHMSHAHEVVEEGVADFKVDAFIHEGEQIIEDLNK